MKDFWTVMSGLCCFEVTGAHLQRSELTHFQAPLKTDDTCGVESKLREGCCQSNLTKLYPHSPDEVFFFLSFWPLLASPQKFPTVWWRQFLPQDFWHGGRVCVYVCVCVKVCVCVHAS